MRETSAYYFLRTAKPNPVPQTAANHNGVGKGIELLEQSPGHQRQRKKQQLLQRMTGGQIHRAIS
jgi:hypothetical protein